MKAQQENLLELVRCALWGSRPEFKSAVDWDVVLHLAGQQTVLGLVAEALSSVPENMAPDKSHMARLHLFMSRNYQAHALLNRKLAEVKGMMDAAGIRTVLFKGQGVAQNYPSPLSRQCGDIDLYVGERQFERAMNIIEPEKGREVSLYRHVKHYNAVSEGVSLEIHRIAEILPSCRADAEFQKWTVHCLEESQLRKVMIGDAEINVPPVDFDALYIMNHAWHHFMEGGIGLRQLCDWSVYLHCFHGQLDIEGLKMNLQRFGLTRAWQIFASVAVRHLGLPAEECPLYTGECDDKAAMVMEVIWQEGNFGKHSKKRRTPRPKGHFAGKWHSFRNGSARKHMILSIAPAEVLLSWAGYFVNGMRNLFVRVR